MDVEIMTSARRARRSLNGSMWQAARRGDYETAAQLREAAQWERRRRIAAAQAHRERARAAHKAVTI